MSEEELKNIEKEKSDASELQSIFQEEGKTQKGSLAAMAQSHADRHKAELGDDYLTKVVQGEMEKEGSTPMEAIDPEKGGHPITISDDVLTAEQQRLNEKNPATQEEFEKTPHFANTSIP